MPAEQSGSFQHQILIYTVHGHMSIFFFHKELKLKLTFSVVLRYICNTHSFGEWS